MTCDGPKRILIAYTSLSGNTRDVARLVRARLEQLGHQVVWLDTDINTLAKLEGGPVFDLYLLGSWTADSGRTPAEMKRFISDLTDATGKPAHVAVFGTGETQWGEEYYCGAVHRMATYFASDYPKLEIEQMPHGDRDTQRILSWTHDVLLHYHKKNSA